ncbi:MAG: hypothetical protein RID09_29590 [Coleofasciculus sp. G1-WW12-02]|uniref:hypothetical protein n=1 Tax=Coleofasciculus sp. G1-WW12-02 TaxID=3068483 RepID=UPI0032F76CB8
MDTNAIVALSILTTSMEDGSSSGITNIIHSLYAHHFAQISEWSPLTSAPVPGKLMRMLIRYVPRQ